MKRQWRREGWRDSTKEALAHRPFNGFGISYPPRHPSHEWWVIWKWSISKCYWWAKLPDSLSEVHIRHMVPQLLPPVAAITIGTPTRKHRRTETQQQRHVGQLLCLHLFCAISYVPLPGVTWNTHTHSMPEIRVTGHMCAHCVCARVWVYIRWTGKTRCQLQKRSCLMGEGEPGQPS